jgi:DNA repair protein RadC
MRGLHQEVVRVVLLDSQLRCITKVDISKGTVNESVAYPREILRSAITHASFGFVRVHNHPSGLASPSAADLQLTKRIAEGAEILNINCSSCDAVELIKLLSARFAEFLHRILDV